MNPVHFSDQVLLQPFKLCYSKPAYFPVLLIQAWGIPVKQALIGLLLSTKARDWAGGTGGVHKASVLYQSASTRCFVLMLIFISIRDTSTPTIFDRLRPDLLNSDALQPKTLWQHVRSRIASNVLNYTFFHLPQEIILLLLFVSKSQTIHLFLPVFISSFLKGCVCMPEWVAH